MSGCLEKVQVASVRKTGRDDLNALKTGCMLRLNSDVGVSLVLALCRMLRLRGAPL